MRYSGRQFSAEEMALIRRIIEEDPARTRCGISKRVCEQLNWRKADGGLKDMSCRVALLRMQEDGLITLPASRMKNGHANGKPFLRRTLFAEPGLSVSMPVHLMKDLRIECVASRGDSYLWNEYIARYHYLGYTKLPGAQLRYWARWNGQELALFGFGACAWKAEGRDRFIGWDAKQREKNLQRVVNNARFLILPWVRSRNLASRLLALISKRVAYDWQQRYGYRPVLLETFVECDRFIGTSYKAANWVWVGRTKGRGKKDVHNHEGKLPLKDIWLYPLQKDFRAVLCS